MQDRALSTPPRGDLPDRVAAAWPPAKWRDNQVAIAVSGGADSVALLRTLVALKSGSGGRGELVVLHYDHGVRGAESAADAEWVASLAESLGLRCLRASGRGDPTTSEESLRNSRRTFYAEAASQLGARYLATGHTADDQAETVLFRALRGSGLRGLAGIRPTAPLTEGCTLVRPLLGVWRAEINAYLAQIAQPHREDATNASADYTRNWLRHTVLPALEERLPAGRESLATLAEHASEAVATLGTLAERLLDRASGAEGPPWRLDRGVLACEPPGLVAEAIRLAWRRAGWPEQAMTAACWRRLTELATQPGDHPAETLPGSIRAEAAAGRLTLASHAE